MEDMYDKVVYLDSDTLVLENVDELFECGPFCAVMRHSELLNSGVLVIDTSEELFQDMKALTGKLGSYTGGDQGFLNSFYPYFAACPAFEPYPPVGSRLAGPGAGLDVAATLQRGYNGSSKAPGGGQSDSRNSRRLASPSNEEGDWIRGCKRLPTRYNGDWPLLFVDGDLQVVQGQELDSNSPQDWKKRKGVKIVHFTLGMAKPWNWWTYPFLPYVDTWVDVFYRATKSSRHMLLSDGERGERPRLGSVLGQLALGLAPLALCTLLVNSWFFSGRLPPWCLRKLRETHALLARYLVPQKSLNARSLVGNVFNFGCGLALALTATLLAFKTVPAAWLGPAKPEAAWAFFWARSTALVIIFSYWYLSLVVTKAKEVFSTAGGREVNPWGTRIGDKTRVGGEGLLCDPRRLALYETMTHLVCLSAMTVSLVSDPLWHGLNGHPASRAILPSLARLLSLFVAFGFSSIRLPTLWAAHATYSGHDSGVLKKHSENTHGPGRGEPAGSLGRSNQTNDMVVAQGMSLLALSEDDDDV